MPKVAKNALIWHPEQGIYELHTQGKIFQGSLAEDNEQWFSWLNPLTSFTFLGQFGRLTLRKEKRARGESYWYAYRSQGHKTIKKYIGRSTDLTPGRLEATAQAIAKAQVSSPSTASAPPSVQLQAEAFPASEKADSAANIAQEHLLLLAPKFSLPRLHTSLIARERLLKRLDAILEHKLALVSAPAGFGKTTLVSQWIASHNQHLPVSWISLDASDNDPIRFWHYVVVAFRSLHEKFGEKSLPFLLQRPFMRNLPLSLSVLNPFLTSILNELTAFTGGGLLVLEDYHLITTPLIHETVSKLLEHLPSNFHVIIITRSDPPLPLARLRAQGNSIEIQADEIRFSLQDTQAFLQHALPFSLTLEVVQHLERRTEGWIAGLRLLTFTLQRYSSPQEIEEFLVSFAGNHRHILEYFVSEVLNTQPQKLQTFLLKTSILTCLTGSLCNAVTESDDGSQLLGILEQANLFVQPLHSQGDWYRYHALFAEALQHEARRQLGAKTLKLCYSRASEWYEHHGMFNEAIETALSAGQFSRIYTLIEKGFKQFSFTTTGELHTLKRWLEQIPEENIAQFPGLLLLSAIVMLFTQGQLKRGRTLEARIIALLQKAEQAWQESGNIARIGETLALHALVIVLCSGDMLQAGPLARQALTYLPTEEQTYRGISLGILGEYERLSGQLNSARQTLLQAYALNTNAGDRHAAGAALFCLGKVNLHQGELRQASEFFQRVLAQAGDDLSDQFEALLGLAEIAYEWNQLKTAEQQAQQALELSKAIAPESRHLRASLLLISILHARGEASLAQEQLLALIAQASISPVLPRKLYTYLARLRLFTNDMSVTTDWLTTHLPADDSISCQQKEREQLLKARVFLAHKQFSKAQSLLERCLADAQQDMRVHTALQIQLLQAQVLLAQGQLPQATQTFKSCLKQAQSEGYCRLFLDEGEPIKTLLHATLPSLNEDSLFAYARRINLAFADPLAEMSSQPTSREILSPQEQRVLQLLAMGHSKPNIADELIVSINTVKTQVKSIYRKLGVSSRKEACAIARRRNLLRE
ncbi:hypothetical protein EPA93_47825 [Ktedonosporobacter rubrisoli]|uniref:HTH luxR-type domain-containing protein n=1 Tax=Ktedonosporobacter rubrisoli TaxID=2509675 RepID=A0A4P6K4L5_KTERU|nr:LuxR C-terminal-related transcriptional regulator [Ktedonosporobacter rubrisoli]QBD83268.1 hypothetical protein EPA93_47825 [Ktedonosporobacter rubrisoli]